MKRKILKQKKYSHHPDDKHLSMVLAKWGEQYVTWGYNEQDKGYFWGHYFESHNYHKAVEDYNKRGVISA